VPTRAPAADPRRHREGLALAVRANHVREAAQPRRVQEAHPEFTVICAADFHASPLIDSTRTPTFIIANFAQRIAIIGGSAYAGEIKKTVFTVLNYLLPLDGVMSMHCSANVGAAGDVAIFFGLSGTGKTTLSADPPAG